MSAPAPVPTVQPAEAKDLLEAGHRLIDVRTPEEYAKGSVAGSINIPIKLSDGSGGYVPNPDFDEQIKAQVTPDTAVVTTCAHGRRGGEAASRLASCGFKQVVNLEGGLANWADQSLPTEGSIQRHH